MTSNPATKDFGQPTNTKYIAQISRLEQDLVELNDKKLQERFYYVSVIIVLINLLIFGLLSAAGSYIPTAIIVLITLIQSFIWLSLSERWRVESIGKWVRLINAGSGSLLRKLTQLSDDSL